MTYDSSRSEQGAVGSSVVRGDRAGHADHADHGFPPEDEGGSLDILGFLQRHQRRFVSATAIVGLLTVGAMAVAFALPRADRADPFARVPVMRGRRARADR